jgi:catechol 2,3-dioxygenase-like lactoylglutathione lyase family enzyme
MKLASIAYLVRDYDEAIAWFVNALGFQLIEDTKLSEKKRWVRVQAPEGGAVLLLAKADGPAQEASVTTAAGGSVGFFLETKDFATTHALFMSRSIKFREHPRHETYGTVAVFEDLYGNSWDLIEPAK